MSAQRWINATTVLRLGIAAALLWSCSSDTPAPSAIRGSQTRTEFDRHHSNPGDGGADAASDLDTNPTITDFVLYAERSVKLGKGDRVQDGDVGVAALTVQSFGPQLVVGDDSFVDPEHDLLASSVQLDAHAVVGDVETSSLTNDGGTLHIQAPLPSPMPPVPIALPATTATTPVTVAHRACQTLAPGAYGALVANGTLFLQPGTYSFSSVVVADGGRVLAQPGGVDLRISENLATGSNATVAVEDCGGHNPTAAAPTSDDCDDPCRDHGGEGDDHDNGDYHHHGSPASNLTISVSGYDGTGGAPAAVALGSGTALRALLAAPHGTVFIERGVTAIGAIAGFDIVLADEVTIAFDSGFRASAPGQQGLQRLAGYITPPMAAAPVLGPADPTMQARVQVGLPIQHLSELQAFLRQVSDATSLTYRQYVSATTFASTYGASLGDYNSIIAFAQAHHFSIVGTFPNHLLLSVNAALADLQTAFHVNINSYQRPDGTQFFALSTEPSLDSTTTILRITGLDNYIVERPAACTWNASGPGQTFPSGGACNSNGIVSCGGTAPGATFFGADLRNAYLNGPPCTSFLGANQVIVLYEADGYNPSDIATYITQSHLDTLYGTHSGQVSAAVDCTPGTTGCSGTSSNGQIEVAADIEVALSIAPQASIELSINGAGDSGFSQFLQNMVNGTCPFCQPQVISDSWSGGWDGNSDQGMQAIAAVGISFFYAAGDVGAWWGNGSFTGFGYPVQPSTTGVAYNQGTLVGGTVLTMSSGGSAYGGETAWQGGGGGILSGESFAELQAAAPFNTYVDQNGNTDNIDPSSLSTPWYQLAFLPNGNGASFTYQNAPDVSGAAFGIDVYVNGQSKTIGGTSLSAPMWAGVIALANEQHGGSPAGLVNPALYQLAYHPDVYATAFNDIGCGSNNNVTGNGFFAGPGYDLATGLGTPRCGLIQQLASPTPTVPVCPTGFSQCSGTDCCPNGQCQQGNVCCPTAAEVCGPNYPDMSTTRDMCCMVAGAPGTCLQIFDNVNDVYDYQCCPSNAVNGGACCGGIGWTVCGVDQTTGVGTCCNGQCNGNGGCCDATQGATACGPNCCGANQACLDPGSGTCGSTCASADEVCSSAAGGCCPPTDDAGAALICCLSLGCIGPGDCTH